MKKLNYGIDAPNVIRNLFIISLLLVIVSIVVNTYFPVVKASPFVIGAIFCFAEGILMLLYSLKGKFRHRDKILRQINWTGNENVLDVGTGLGLLMIGAAKKLTTGKSIGIDIWNKEDLTQNTSMQTMINAELEGVSAKIEIINQNILKTDFPDNHFDVILSNLCLHNIYDKPGREQACKEIYRILKPGGTVVISDFRKNGEYKNTFNQCGMKTKKTGTYYFETFPPLTIIKSSKII